VTLRRATVPASPCQSRIAYAALTTDQPLLDARAGRHSRPRFVFVCFCFKATSTSARHRGGIMDPWPGRPEPQTWRALV